MMKILTQMTESEVTDFVKDKIATFNTERGATQGYDGQSDLQSIQSAISDLLNRQTREGLQVNATETLGPFLQKLETIWEEWRK